MSRKGTNMDFVEDPKRNLHSSTNTRNSEAKEFSSPKSGTEFRIRMCAGSNQQLDRENLPQCENDCSNIVCSNRLPVEPKIEISENEIDYESNLRYVKLLTYQPDNVKGKMRYSCTECVKSFNAKTSLARHQKTHSGERPFHCTECDKRFIQNGDLVRHQRSHSGERPYHCSECNKSFSQIGHLRNHQKMHAKNDSLEPLSRRESKAIEKGKQCICTEHEYNPQMNANDHQKDLFGGRAYQFTDSEKIFKCKDNIAPPITIIGEQPNPYNEGDKGFSQNTHLVQKEKTQTEERTGRGSTTMVRLIEVTITNDYFESEDHRMQELESKIIPLKDKIAFGPIRNASQQSK